MKQTFNIEGLRNKVLPPLPLTFINGKDTVEDVRNQAERFIESSKYADAALVVESVDRVERTIFGTPQVTPVKMKLKNDSDWWLFPVEPLVAVNGKNTLIKRNVSKSTGRGTIKERWAQADYEITISGLITTPNSDQFPIDDLKQLKRFSESKEAIDILSPILLELGVVRVVIEDFEFPFTKGPENQAYSLKCLSDDDYDLFIKIDTQQ